MAYVQTVQNIRAQSISIPELTPITPRGPPERISFARSFLFVSLSTSAASVNVERVVASILLRMQLSDISLVQDVERQFWKATPLKCPASFLSYALDIARRVIDAYSLLLCLITLAT
jgi:hypothetical protein